MPATDRDVVLGYQLFLGRDPENSFVIADARSTPVHSLMRGLLSSEECAGSVLAPLGAGRPLPHERGSPGPDEEQTAWLLRNLAMDEASHTAFRAAENWRSLLTALAALPGFPTPHTGDAQPAGAPASPDATPGFVLITIEQPRGGEVLTGRRLEGSGWVIAPSDIAEISVTLGGRVLTRARYGLPRPDVARRFPHYRQVEHCGFAFSAEVPDDAGAADLLTIEVRTANGEQGRRSVRVKPADAGAERAAYPATHPGPAAVDAAPHAAASAVVVRIEGPEGGGEQAPPFQALALSGWAVARAGIASVTLFSGEQRLGDAHLGIRREDMAAAFADYDGALMAGWAFVVPPGALTPGGHRLRAVAADAAGTLADHAVSIWVDAQAPAASHGSLRTSLPAPEAAFAHRVLGRQSARPWFTVLIRAPGDAGDDEAAAAATLASLARQVLPDFHVTLAVGSPPAAASLRALPGAFLLGDRLSVIQPGDPIAGAEHAPAGTRPMICVLRPGDVLGCDALLEFALAAAGMPEAELIYADDRRHDPQTGTVQPFYKPDFAPEQLLGMNYAGRAWCAPAEAAARAGLTPQALLETSDYDAVLRLTETCAAVHVPRVLMEACPPGDTPGQEAAALQAAAVRRGFVADVRAGPAPGLWRVRRTAAGAGRVSVVMPTCGAAGLVKKAIATLRAGAAAGPPLEIVVVDDLPASARALRTWLRKAADVVVRAEGAFNWSRFNNRGAAAATGDILLFLNDDIEMPGPGWLAPMLEQALRPEVGVVGAQLLYPDGRVQHAGLYLAEGHARHAFRFADGNGIGPFGIAAVAREVSGVTGACLMMRRDVFDRLGGFDEAHSVINNDLDICLRARSAGLSVIYTPHARMLHHEMASRADLHDSYDRSRFLEAFGRGFAAGDPFRNPALAPHGDHYAADPEPAVLVYPGKPAGRGNLGPPNTSVRRILALKLDHIGDFITALPALRALKAQFPQARLTLLAPPATLAIAALEPAIDETLEFTFFNTRSSDGPMVHDGAALAALEARLAPLRFDMAIDLRMQPETRPVLRATGAPFLSGYDHDGRFPWLDVALEWEGDRKLQPKRTGVAERLLQLVAATAAAFAPAATPLALPHDAADETLAGGSSSDWPTIAELLPQDFAGRRLVCVHPGVGNPLRQWPPAHFAALIDLLLEEPDIAIVLVGTEAEASVADTVRRLLPPGAAVCSLAGKLPLSALPALLRACVLFVGNNSGPQHLAASLGVPTVGVHAGIVDAREWGPVGDAAVAIQRRMTCGPCYIQFADECPRAFACLTGLRPRDVLAACRRVMAGVMATDRSDPPPAGDRALNQQPPMPPSSPRDTAPRDAAPPPPSPAGEAGAVAILPLQHAGQPQGYIETLATDGAGSVWIVGWMRRDHPLEFPAVVSAGGRHPVSVGVMTFPRHDLPADAWGILGLVAGGWEPAIGDDGKPLEFTIFFGAGGCHHLRCHVPLRLITTRALAGEYQDLLARGMAMRQAPSLQRLLGALESWQPTARGGAWLGTEASVDRILLIPGLGCMAEGWILSPLRRIETLRLRVGGVVMTLMPPTLSWKPRQDLAAAYPESEAMAARGGFTGLFEALEEPADFADPVLKLVFEGGASVNLAVPPKIFRRLGQSAGIEAARAFFPALEEEAFFPRFAAAAAAAERALMAPPVPVTIAAAARVLVFALPQDRCDLFLLFEEVARHLRPPARAGSIGGVVFLGSAGNSRSDALWLFREFARDMPGIAASLMMIAEPAHAFASLPAVLAAVGAQRFLFVAGGVFLTPAGWQAAPRVLGGEPAALVCLADAGGVPGAACFGWSTGGLAGWSRNAVAYLGGLFGDNGLAAASPAVVPGAIRSSRSLVRSRLQDAVNRALEAASA